jgi:hypothetical protein
MHRLLPCSLLLCAAVVVGCGGSREDQKSDERGAAPPDRMTIENVARIQREELNYPGVQQIFAGPGEPTNEDRPGLMPGNRYVWKDGNRKVFVSFNPINGKANGVSWEGFGGK